MSSGSGRSPPPSSSAEEEEEETLSPSPSPSSPEDSPSPSPTRPLLVRRRRRLIESTDEEEDQPFLPPPARSTNLPLRTQIRILIERALQRQLQENRSPRPQRGALRRWCDTLFLLFLVAAMRFHKEIAVLVLLFFSGFASLRNGPLKTRPTPDPVPFLGDPAVPDYYKGEYVGLVEREIGLGPAFVFYYAPWDSESVRAREVFLRVARHFRASHPRRFRFYGVNCWWPEGECRRNYKNLSHFPILVAHLDRSSGIIYSGPIRYELMVRFLSSLLKPLTRIDDEEELWRFRAQHDAIMLGYFNFSQPEAARNYEVYRHMALRSLESDPFGQVGFGVFLKEGLAEKYFLSSSNVISLVLFNEIHTAKWTGEKEVLGPRGPVAQVANWLGERTRNTPLTWAYQLRTGFANRPVALGASDLATEMERGPLILLVTRRYFPSAYSPFYAQVREVALDYLNCNRSGNVTRLRRTTHKLNAEWVALWDSVARVCGEGGDGGVGCRLLKEELEHWRRRKSALVRDSLGNYERLSQQLNFTGFSCSAERKFRFYAVDPVDMPHFLHLAFGGLGVKGDSDPVLFLIDGQRDLIFPIRRFNITELAEMIYLYSNLDEDDLDEAFPSALWSESSKQKISLGGDSTPEHAGSNSFVQELLSGDHYKGAESCFRAERRSELVHSLSSDQVLRFLETERPLFLMFTVKFCGSCGVALGNFMELSRFLRENYPELNVTFGKIDMLKNSLPLHLSPEALPTFAFFPGSEEGRGLRVFPAEEVVTTKSLLRFLLSSLDSETRVRLSLTSPTCLKRNATHCISANRASVREGLEALLTGMGEMGLEAGEVGWQGLEDLDNLRSMKVSLDLL